MRTQHDQIGNIALPKLMTTKTFEDHIDLLDRFLLSDRAPDNSMGLSDLDGFLTGIVVGPELIMPSDWLPEIWGGESPKFKNIQEAESVMSALMARYNEIVRGFQHNPPDFEPIFWETKNGLVIAADWAEGFNDAIKMRPKAWKPLLDHKDGANLLKPIIILCGDKNDVGRDDPAVESELMARATDDLPESIVAIHAFWIRQKRLR
jgi:uncharacterized protein